MPKVFQKGAYRFFFVSSDGDEPYHIHVREGKRIAKFWVSPVRLQKNIGFTPNQLRQIEKLIKEHKEQIKEAWDEYFSS